MIKRIKIENLFGGEFNYNINFDTNPHYITGPNGYGKSTILKIINDFLTCAEEIIYDMDTLSISRVTIEFTEGATIEYEFTGNKLFIVWYNINNSQVFKEERGIKINNIIFHINDIVCYPDSCKNFLDNYKISVITELSYDKYFGKNILDKKKLEIDYLTKIFPKFEFPDQSLIFEDNIMSLKIKDRIIQTENMISIISTGESMMLSILCNLLFNDSNVFLIDNIENNLHVALQHMLGDNILEDIINLRKRRGKDIQIICTTHSPSFISNHWDRVIDLFDLSIGKEK